MVSSQIMQCSIFGIIWCKCLAVHGGGECVHVLVPHVHCVNWSDLSES